MQDSGSNQKDGQQMTMKKSKAPLIALMVFLVLSILVFVLGWMIASPTTPRSMTIKEIKEESVEFSFIPP
jgi:hypothetical protein